MYTNILVLDNGTEIQANQTGSTITNLVYTATVSSTTDLCPGAACAAKIEFTVWVQPGSSLAFTSGTRVKYYQEDAGGSRTLVGTFWAVKPTKQTRNSYKVYAYDAVSKLDGIQSTWLRSIQDDFPMSLWSFAQAVAQQCGVTLENSSLPRSGSYQVQAFYGDNLTGRQLLGWVAEASCTFLRATPSGGIEFAWYTTNTQMRISPDGQPVNGVQAVAYRDGGLSYEDYQTATIDKVQIKQSDDDVGVIYPANETGTNALVIKGNLLLTTSSAELLQPVARSIYTAMQGITYTPLKVSLFSNGVTFAPGQIVTVKDPQGNILQTYVMTVQQSGAKISLESTGNASRDGTAAVNEEKLNLNGKILEISATVDGLTIKASDLAGGMASLNLTVDGLRTEVSGKLGEADAKTMIEQGLESLTLTAESDAEDKDIKGDAQWADMRGNAAVTDGVLTIVGTTQESIASLYVPADNLPGLGGRKITYTFEYKVNETVSGEACDVILWYDYQNESDGGYYVLRITTGPGDTAQPTDWTPVSWTIEMKRDTIKKLQFAASIKKNAQGSVSIRNVGITTEAESNSSTLVLRAGGTELSSTQVKITGVVTFADLSGSGTTVINGDNIKTGTIQGTGGSSLWSLDSGTFISGVSDSTRVEINFNGIRWYSSNYLTGVLYSEYGKTYLGSNSTYTFLGWFSSGYPSISANKQKYDDNFGGLYYDHGSRLIHCVAEKFEIPGRIECESLGVNGREI